MAYRSLASSLSELGLGPRLADYDEAAIHKAWKTAFARVHPDKGGSSDACTRLTAARDFVLMALELTQPPAPEPYCQTASNACGSTQALALVPA